MQLRYEIPDTFWSLFRSVNREIYMESLLVINEEYQYSNYAMAFENRMAEEDRRLQYDDDQHCDTGLCGNFY